MFVRFRVSGCTPKTGLANPNPNPNPNPTTLLAALASPCHLAMRHLILFTSSFAFACHSVTQVNMHGWQWAVMIMSSLNHSWRWSLSYPSTPPSTSRKRRRWPASVTTTSSTVRATPPRTTPPLPKMNPSSNHFPGPKVPPRSSSFACCSPCLWARQWVSFRRL